MRCIKKSGWAKGVYISLLVLAVIVTIGIAFLPQAARNVANGIGEILFLPLISKPHIYESSNTNIYWEKDIAPYPLAYAQLVTVTVAYNEYLYLIGGGDVKVPSNPNSDPIIEQSPRVRYAPLNGDGTVGEWNSADDSLDLPKELYGASATAVDGLIYVLGGLYHSPREPYPEFNNQAYCANVNSNGTFVWETKSNDWDLFSEWFKGVAYLSTVVVNDRIYIIGGLRRKMYFNQTWHPTRFVLSAKLERDGLCQDLNWEVELIGDDSLPKLMNHTAVGIETKQGAESPNYIYVMGGEVWEKCLNQKTGDPCQNRVITKRLSEAVFRVEIDGSGKLLGPWENIGDFTNEGGVHLMKAVQTGDYIYLLGGTRVRNPDNAPATGCIYRTKLLEDGGISSWEKLNSERCELTLYGHAATVSSYGRLYVIGGAQVANKGAIPVVSNTIYWTPLAFLSKVSNPNDAISPGDQVTYNLTVTSNNVRDLYNVEVKDILPANLQPISAPGFTYDEPILTSGTFELPINHLVRFTITAEVSPVETPTPNGSPTVTTPSPEPEPQITVTPATPTVQPVETNVRPTQVKGCVTVDDVISSGTPRPKPTCTPTPTPALTLTSTATPTSTDTPTATPTATDTPPVPIPPPEPVFVVNQAFVCFNFEEQQQEQLCKMAMAVNAPFRTYLPLVTK